MKTIILDRLRSIEQEHQIKIHFACESGSRGWQFPSPDSDYDVRFVYTRPMDNYLSVMPETEHLSFPISAELDVYGWDLKKVLRLMMKSNTTIFEWLQSSIIYRTDLLFKQELWQLCAHFFNERRNIHHYLGIARGAYESLSDTGEIGIKKLFYVLRSLLSAKWCLDKNQIAPMEIGPLAGLLPGPLQKIVNDMVAYKATAKEQELVMIDPILKAYIDNEMIRISCAEKILIEGSFDVVPLNQFLKKTLEEK